MTTTLFKTVVLATFCSIVAKAQPGSPSYMIDSLAKFNTPFWTDQYYATHEGASGLPEYIHAHQRNFIAQNFFPVPAPGPMPPTPPPMPSCTNMDFEAGSLTGWIESSGYNPLYNSIGCCLTPGGAQVITSGAGNDPCGGFPVVDFGGSFSVRLGNNSVGGEADRLEQTFNVNASNANFTYKYAVVFEDPGHAVADQPKFEIEMIDSSGAPIPCTFYSVSAGAGIPGFLNSSVCAGVIYKPWSSVAVDLTSYIGQNVTIRFTTYDCSLGGHYGYAYIDGSCMSFNINQSGILCQGSTVNLTAPGGFATYKWTLPDLSTRSTQIISTGLPGTYTLNMTTMSGCPGPTMLYTLVANPKPAAAFTPVQSSACSHTISFVNTSTVSSGSIITHNWNFGDGNTSSIISPTNIYAGVGTYTVDLICTTDMGCKDTAKLPVSISPLPTVSFTANPICLNGTTSFTNTSSVSSGTITTYNWLFGDGTTSSLNQPTHIYAGAGTFAVTLSITTSDKCSNSATQTISVYPLPVASFSATNVCDQVRASYTNLSSISSGSITNYLWDFNSDGFIDTTAISGSFLFPAPGTYSSKLTLISDHNCSATYTAPVIVYPNPVVNFSVSQVCQGVASVFANTSTIASGAISLFNWNFGDLASSIVANPTHTYSTYGSYTVTLSATSKFGCVASKTMTTAVNPKPVVSFKSTVTCLNQGTAFTNLSSIPTGTISKYQWDFDDDGILDDSTANPSFMYKKAGLPLAKLIAISNNNCSNYTVNIVTVHANPVANFHAPSTCLPMKTAFTDLSSCADGTIVAYNWDFNGDGMIDNFQKNPTYSFLHRGNYGVKLEVQSQYGCVNTILKSAYVNPVPTVVFAADNKIGCPSLCVNFLNKSTIDTGKIVTYQWIFGDNTSPGYEQNSTHCYQTGEYAVTLKAVSDSGCVSSTTLPNLVKVYPAPTANFNMTPNEVDVTEPIVEVQNQAVGATHVKYIFSDGTIKNVPDFKHTFVTEEPQTIYIKQIASNQYACKDSIVKPLVIKPVYALFIPNAFTPNGDGLNDGFRAKGFGIAQFRLQIFDRWGAMVFESTDIEKSWDGSINGQGDYETTKQDVYVWKAEVTDVLMKQHDLIGKVTLVK